MKVKILIPRAGLKVAYNIGDIVDIPEAQAVVMAERGEAELLEPLPEIQSEPAETEKTAKKSKKKADAKP
ncbi:hypothetical protein [Piscirickettsia litoralis]|uniref:Uncharacterized protein n=1 Tax=Piscirickettsia litoralis TaxID=1891921 RepID=A0ABX2ZXP7_9GAMM|nr:hypothetical protein [Piscirickettsia litoralis]ODN40998.1 hypothetical protein BGC07_18370 [Piscirickettsia litoralis]